jgi:hypothetical protein
VTQRIAAHPFAGGPGARAVLPCHSRRVRTVTQQSDRRLYQIGQLPDLLQLSTEQIDWLVKTGQLRTIRICGEVRFDSTEVSQLIETYNQIAKRKQDHVQ